MNETATAPPMSSSGANSPPPFYQNLILRVFATLTEGQLRLELPDGSVREFGRSDAAVCARIAVRNPVFFQRCVLYGDVGFGESYVDGDWETNSIERVISWAIANVHHLPSMSGSKVRTLFFNSLKGLNRFHHWLRPNSLATSRRNIAEHYDLGNDFYSIWLDPTLTYSSARYTTPGQSLESAQFSKYDALCQKLRLQPTDHVLEIGSGWGGFSLHAARHYGCRVTTITISEAQFKLARQRFGEAGLSDRIQILLQDYRHLSGSFDKIVSIEMMEALGDKYLQTYLTKLNQLLKPGGLIGLQFITVPDHRHAQLRRGVDWIQKHIFPGSLLLSLGRVNQVLSRTSDLTLHELEDLGASYAKTLHVWWERFNAKLDEVAALGFDSRFIRKWNYYLQYCEAAFASRNISVVQAVYSRPNNPALHTAF
jgi:cyclopropane-fatty-acyl-phospholipid synthase